MLSVDFGHELLQANRAFLYPYSPVQGLGWKQLNHLWPIQASEAGLDWPSDWGMPAGGHPTILTGPYASANDPACYLWNWPDVWPDQADKDFTIIARFTLRTAPTSGSAGWVLSAVGQSPGYQGFTFGVYDAGGSGAGLAVLMFDNNGSYQRGDFIDQQGFTGLTNVPVVGAAVYRSQERTMTFYRDGVMTRAQQDTSRDWGPWSNDASTRFIVGRAFDGSKFSGEIGWVMVFARALSAEEIVTLGRDTEWPFLDEPPFAVVTVGVTYTTEVFTHDAMLASNAGPVTYVTGVAADFAVDGDLSATPPAPAVATYTTDVAAAGVVYFSSPQLVVYTTTVTVDPTATSGTPVTYATTVSVSVRSASLVDGRADLIATELYRR